MGNQKKTYELCAAVSFFFIAATSESVCSNFVRRLCARVSFSVYTTFCLILWWMKNVICVVIGVKKMYGDICASGVNNMRKKEMYEKVYFILLTRTIEALTTYSSYIINTTNGRHILRTFCVCE